MNRTEPLVLSLETAIGGGSIALVRGNHVIAENDLGNARANVILTAIESILKQTDMQIADVGKLAVSLGPGSFTGIRVGLSTVLGLRRSLNVEMVGVSAFEAIAARSTSEEVVVIIPIGRNMVGYQIFGEARNGPFAVADEESVPVLAIHSAKRAFLVASGHDKIVDELLKNGIPIEMIPEAGLAGIIGQFAVDRNGSDTLEPIYLR
jgi:tRNA threonylcarbamoyladenosine biosynthesis protein TsaB